jgi:hypothetical protein
MRVALQNLAEPLVIIPDVRFKNELDFIKSQGGIMIRVEGASTSDDTHVSENQLDNEKFDYTVYNNGTFQELDNQVKSILNQIK